MAFCPRCGSPVEPRQRFCGTCGAPLSDLHENMTHCRQTHGEERRWASSLEQQNQKELPASASPAPPPPPPVAAGSVFTPRIIIGIVAAIIIIAAVIFFVLPGGLSSGKSTRGTGQADSGGLSAPGTTTPCPVPLFACNGSCADLRTDTGNCGACGAICPQGQSCQNSTCAVSCSGGMTNCNGTCYNLRTNSLHCGTCTTPCPAGFSCRSGQCTPPAPAGPTLAPPPVTTATAPLPTDSPCGRGETLCSGACTNLMTDPVNCAVCGRTCAMGEKCLDGRCGPMCSGTTTFCNGICSNLKTDMNNCGSCGTVCPKIPPNTTGGECMNGYCTIQCKMNYMDCNGNIADGCEVYLRFDVNNCGSCGIRCPKGQICNDKMCVVQNVN